MKIKVNGNGKKVDENVKNEREFKVIFYEKAKKGFLNMEKIIKRISLILITLCAVSGIAFAATDTDTTSGDNLYAKDILKNHKPYVYFAVDLTCRELKDKNLKTQIVDFDIAKGITYCQIYKKDNPDFILNINADAQWQLIRSSKFKEYDKATASTKIESMSSNIGKSTGNSSDGDTLSTFMVKTVLLMDNSGGSKGTNVTEYDATSFKDTWDNSSGAWETFANIADTVWENVKAPVKWVASKFGAETEVSKRELKVPYVASASDGFDAENLAYYRALFNGMNSIYIYLQNTPYDLRTSA